MACSEKLPPLELPFKNVSLPDIGPRAFARGIPVAIGTPMQQFSLLPLVSSNHTSMTDVVECQDPSFDRSCGASVGGLYEFQKSSTVVLTSFPAWSDSDHDPSSLDNMYDTAHLYLEDTVHFADNSSLTGFPLFDIGGIASERAILGLSTYSTFLNKLTALGRAPSSIWSIWTGSLSLDYPVDGLLMIGGYDEARIVGELRNFTSNLDCELPLNLTNFSYEVYGQSTSLLDQSHGYLQVCMDPGYDFLELPQAIFDKFAAATNGSYDSSTASLTYPKSEMPAGNLVVTLSDGYSTTIPNNELFTKIKGWDEEGRYILDGNYAEKIAAVVRPNFGVTPARFGQPYMTMNYIIVDHAHSMYRMAPANRSKFSDTNRAQRPKAICRQEHPITTIFNGISSPTQFSSTVVADSSVSFVSAGPKNSDIVGSIAGVMLGAATLALLALIVLIKYHKRVKNAATMRRKIEAMEPLTGQGSEHQEDEIQNRTKRKRASSL